MKVDGTFKVNGFQFSWNRITTFNFPELHYLTKFIESVEIRSESYDFHIVIRINPMHSDYYRSFGPFLVLGSQFPNTENPIRGGRRLLLRPRIAMVKGQIIEEKHYERIVQWCLSSKFKVMRAGASGAYLKNEEIAEKWNEIFDL